MQHCARCVAILAESWPTSSSGNTPTLLPLQMRQEAGEQGTMWPAFAMEEKSARAARHNFAIRGVRDRRVIFIADRLSRAITPVSSGVRRESRDGRGVASTRVERHPRWRRGVKVKT